MHISDMNNWENYNIKDAEYISCNYMNTITNTLVDFLKLINFFHHHLQ